MGIRKQDQRVQFAQLYGMAEALSYGLRNGGFQVSKYLPFGPVEQIMPYLLRRAEENRGLLSTSFLDRQLMRFVFFLPFDFFFFMYSYTDIHIYIYIQERTNEENGVFIHLREV